MERAHSREGRARGAVFFKAAFFASFAALAAGCGANPEDVFKDLKEAALAKDATAVWEHLTPDTKKDIAARADAFFSGLGGGRGGAAAADGEVFEYFSGLVVDLDIESLIYIRGLRIAAVTTKGDTATMSLSSLRYGQPEKALVFERIDGRWLWDAREILDFYLENRWR